VSKLHELLAVDGNLKGQADKTRTDLRATFANKRHLFEEKVVTFKPVDETERTVTESQLDLQTTVRKELSWISDILAKSLDVSFQVADANTKAKASIVLEDGTTLAEDVPATALLELEKRAGELQELVASIPTLDPAKGFKPAPARGDGIYEAREAVTRRTKKVQRPIVLYQATPEHPAQTQLITEDVVTGQITTQEWSGLLTPAEKADMFERVERLRRAIKKARARANEATVDTTRKVGDSLLKYVFGN
jgi:hypothetical protein